jgi:hypothetical protein
MAGELFSRVDRYLTGPHVPITSTAATAPAIEVREAAPQTPLNVPVLTSVSTGTSDITGVASTTASAASYPTGVGSGKLSQLTSGTIGRAVTVTIVMAAVPFFLIAGHSASPAFDVLAAAVLLYAAWSLYWGWGPVWRGWKRLTSGFFAVGNATFLLIIFALFFYIPFAIALTYGAFGGWIIEIERSQPGTFGGPASRATRNVGEALARRPWSWIPMVVAALFGLSAISDLPAALAGGVPILGRPLGRADTHAIILRLMGLLGVLHFHGILFAAVIANLLVVGLCVRLALANKPLAACASLIPLAAAFFLYSGS